MKEAKAKAPIPKMSLAPGMVPSEELPDLWRRSIVPFFDARPVAKPQQHQRLPDIHQYHLDKFLFIDSQFPAQTFTRDSRWLQRNDDSDHLLLQVWLSGENFGVNGTQDFAEKPGNTYAVNLARQVEATSTDGRALSLVLPRNFVMDEIPHLAEARGTVFAPESASARIFVDYISSLGRNLSQATAAEIPAIVQGTLGLLNSLTLCNDIGSSSALDATYRTVCRYIDAHLENPALGVSSICRYLRCSRATLYRLFKPHGGVRQHIQRRRLVACFKAISAPKYRHRHIFDVAVQFGFTSPSHFSHLFRTHFGMTPREARDTGLNVSPGVEHFTAAGGSGNDVVERMWEWAKTLTAHAPASSMSR